MISRKAGQILAVLYIAIIGTTGLYAQEKEITLSEFWEYMRRSQAETKDASFRESTTIELSDFPDKGWEPYSSWTNESVFPDSSKTVYTSRSHRKIIHIGINVYTKEPDGPWIRQVKDKANGVNPPAALYGHAKSRITVIIPSPDTLKGHMLIRAVSKAWHVKDAKKDTKVTDYWYDEKGVLIRKESIGYTGEKWLQRIEIYEYDSSIKIEAPID